MDSKVEKFQDGQRKLQEKMSMQKGRCRNCGCEWPLQILANGYGLCPRCQKVRERER